MSKTTLNVKCHNNLHFIRLVGTIDVNSGHVLSSSVGAMYLIRLDILQDELITADYLMAGFLPAH